jgi:hypothetical protein
MPSPFLRGQLLAAAVSSTGKVSASTALAVPGLYHVLTHCCFLLKLPQLQV